MISANMRDIIKIPILDFGVTSHNVIDQSMIINLEMKNIFEVKPSKIREFSILQSYFIYFCLCIVEINLHVYIVSKSIFVKLYILPHKFKEDFNMFNRHTDNFHYKTAT
jgi:hypothetical protein